LRRVRTADGIEHQVLRDGGWTPDGGIAATAFGGRVFDVEWERSTADRHLQALPMQPVPAPVVPRLHALRAAQRGRRARLGAPVPTGRRPRGRRVRAGHAPHVPGVSAAAPSYSKALDYELELGFVLARPLLDATPDEAVAAIGAFVLVNDFSARDVQRAEMRSGFGLQKAKTFMSSMSETAVTADEVLPRLHRLAGEVRLNDQTVATVSSAGARWSLGEVLAHASCSERLLPGELFATGTLPGGCALENGAWPQPGDTLRLTLDDVAEVTHPIVEG
jgi:hypothetical protein